MAQLEQGVRTGILWRQARLKIPGQALQIARVRMLRRQSTPHYEICPYQRRTKQAEALIAGAYLSGTNTRRVRRALSAVFKGAVGKDVVSRTWRKVKGD